jgi:hypothetical protein
MQDKKWVRVGLATLILGAAFGCVSAAGCGSSSSPVVAGDAGHDGTSSSSGSSSGVSGSSSGTSGSSSGASGSSSGGTAPPNANVYLVNSVVDPAAPPTFRFCFGVPSVTDGGPVSVIGGYDPLPDTKVVPYAPAGLPMGTGGLLNSNKQIQSLNLASLSLKVYALRGDNAVVKIDTADGGPDGGAEAPCEYLIGSDALGATTTGNPMPYKGVLTLGTDYFYVGEIAKGQLATGTTWVAALEGCVPGEPNAEAPYCGGAAYSAANGNLQLQLYALDTTTKLDGGALGAQFAQTSIAWDAVMTGLSALYGDTTATTAAGLYVPTPVPEAGTDAGDAGDAATGPLPPTQITIESMGTFGTLKPMTLAAVPGVTFDGNSGFFATGLAGGTTPIQGPPEADGAACTIGVDCASPWLMPLPVINELTQGLEADGGMPPNEFANGAGYVFILIGDPTAHPYIDFTTGNACAPGPTAPTCIFNTGFTHFLAFPTL